MKVIAFYGNDITKLAGTERAMFSVANGLAEIENYKIIIISTKGDRSDVKYELNEKIQIVCLNIGNNRKELFKLIKSLRRVVMENKVDVLVSVEVMSILFTLPALKLIKKNVKLVVWEHFNYTVTLGLKIRNYCRKLSSKFADSIVVLTQRDVELWENNLKIKNQITAINNPSPYRATDKPYNTTSKNIVAIGRLTYQKGFDRLLDVWAKFLKDNHNHRSWNLQIIGSGPDKEALMNQASSLNLTNHVEWIENTPNIKDFYNGASFLAMTSRFEGLPMTLIEAQAFRLPIIAYDCITGPGEVITKNSGILIPDGNDESFIIGLKTMIENDALRNSMSNSSLEEYKRFLPEVIVKKWDMLFSNL